MYANKKKQKKCVKWKKFLPTKQNKKINKKAATRGNSLWETSAENSEFSWLLLKPAGPQGSEFISL
jgi:hypothetical protein